MDMTIFLALTGFAFVTSVTPGPNNLMVMASSANFGIRRTVPHIIGISLGFALMIALVGFGLTGIFDAFPVAYTVLKAVSIVYLLYLAWKIATAAPRPTRSTETDAGTEALGRPFTFLQAAGFQWVNPKAWTMALAALSVYAPTRTVAATLVVAAVFAVICLPSVGLWAFFGRAVQGVLENGRRLRMFNITMALLLVATLYPVILS